MNTFFVQLKEALAKTNPAYIKVKVIPKSPANEIVDLMADGTYKIRVAAVAEKNKANQELCKFLKKELGLQAAEILSGKTDRIKLVRLTA